MEQYEAMLRYLYCHCKGIHKATDEQIELANKGLQSLIEAAKDPRLHYIRSMVHDVIPDGMIEGNETTRSNIVELVSDLSADRPELSIEYIVYGVKKLLGDDIQASKDYCNDGDDDSEAPTDSLVAKIDPANENYDIEGAKDDVADAISDPDFSEDGN